MLFSSPRLPSPPKNPTLPFNASTKPVNFDDMTVRIIKANTVQIMDYYPFGLMWEKQDVASTDNLKWHHGKELQENEFAQQGKSLDLEDFGARMYDPILGRWWSVDPLAEQRSFISPYNFVSNNPLSRIDPSGRLDRKYNVLEEDGTTSSQEIQDGVDETYTIAESDYNTLLQLFESGDNTNYEKHIEQLALGTKGYDIALTARSYEGSTEWAYENKKGNFPENTYKCNKFVQDVLAENDAAPSGQWPPLAGKWADKNAKIENWSVVNGSPKLGDVVAGAYPYTDASGHVVIVTGIDPKSGEITSMGTVNSHTIGNDGFGNNMINNGGHHNNKTYGPIAIRRYSGN